MKIETIYYLSAVAAGGIIAVESQLDALNRLAEEHPHVEQLDSEPLKVLAMNLRRLDRLAWRQDLPPETQRDRIELAAERINREVLAWQAAIYRWASECRLSIEDDLWELLEARPPLLRCGHDSE